MFVCTYSSPLGEILITADGEALTGLWFRDGKYCPELAEASPDAPILIQTRQWLAEYFSGKAPGPLPPLRLEGTPFQQKVWALLLQIPFGAACTYGELATALGISSARAVGQAVSRNPISILVPCHRVVGRHGVLTGYAGGLDRKAALLRLERQG